MTWKLVNYCDENDYRAHFVRVYCSGPINTHDGIAVRFRRDQFDHCFYESTRRNGIKDQFSGVRAERIDWIKATLEDPSACQLAGWDAQKRRYDHNRRVALVKGNYVVVISLKSKTTANFVTAYLMDTPASLQKLTKAPKWVPPP
ncbi:MAG: hypothetical protein EAZ81_08905 [Verrucomicrobia bacterium]|nr:MAG: hypothetical protein EAZ81_08905 [Verrucomicrobiota bacterium]